MTAINDDQTISMDEAIHDSRFIAAIKLPLMPGTVAELLTTLSRSHPGCHMIETEETGFMVLFEQDPE